MLDKLPGFSDTQLRIWCLEVDPKLTNLRIHVQEEMNLSVGIMRDNREAQLGDSFRINDMNQIGPNLKSALEIRWGTITYDLHIQRFERTYPDQQVIGFVGNGNLLFNDYFVSWTDGKCYHLRDEPLETRVYTSLVMWRDGHATIEDLRYSGNQVICAGSNRNITDEVTQCTSGQRLLRNGVPVDWKKLAEMALDGRFPDLRHLLRFPALQDGPFWSDIGLEQIAKDPSLLRNALEMRTKVPLRVDVSHKVLRQALTEKGYHAEHGDYELRRGTLWLRFKPGLYPHSAIGIRPDGVVVSLLVTGLSNRAGITVEGAAILLHKLGASDGMLIDNGGDVMMQYFGDMVVTSSELGRRELRSVILFTKDRETMATQSPETMGIKLVRYPPF